jgi:glycosyltransferase involved in cell wall biosynthesis
VNDGSRDATLARSRRSAPATAPADRRPRRELRRGGGALRGFAHARGDVVVTLDGDGQNDPADIPRSSRASRPSRRRERPPARAEGGVPDARLPSRIANWLIAAPRACRCTTAAAGSRRTAARPRRGPAAARDEPLPPAILGVTPSAGRRGHGERPAPRLRAVALRLSRTFVVLRDLLALPILVRRPPAAELGARSAARRRRCVA